MTKKNDALSTEDKVVLLLSLVPYLLENGPTKIEDISREFNVSKKELRKLAAFLGTAGIPGESNAYLPGDLFDIDWDALEDSDVLNLVNYVALDHTPKFSASETATLIAGIELLSGKVPEKYDSALESVLTKLARSSYGYEQTFSSDEVDNLGEHIKKISAAINSNETLCFHYTSKTNQASTRRVMPVILKQIDGNWYLEGFCFDRSDSRLFRIEAMRNLAVKETTQSEINQLKEQTMRHESADTAIDAVLEISAEALRSFDAWHPEIISKDNQKSLKIKVQLFDAKDVIKLVTLSPGHVKVLEPHWLIKDLMDTLETLRRTSKNHFFD